MTATGPATGPGRQAAAAESEIERDYAALEAEVLGTVRAKLAASGAPVDHDALGAAYNQAWHALYGARVAGEQIENRTGFLVQVTYRRALDERRAARRATELAPIDAEHGAEQDIDGQLDDRLRVRALMQGMRERLDARELHAATLCYVHGYTRPEAARTLGVRPRRFEKVMDHVSKELSGLVGDLRAGDWCDSRRSLISAYALGVLATDGERYRLASAHLEDCPACRRRVLCMRGLAGVVPPAPLLLAALPTGGAGAGAALAEHGSWLARLGGHGMEIAAGGAAVAAATSVLVVFGPPADWGSQPDAAPSPVAAATPAPLPASASAGLRAAAAGSAARARADARRRSGATRRARAQPTPAPPTTAPTGQPEPAPASSAPATPTPAPATPAPPPDTAPADDGWEEFELRR